MFDHLEVIQKLLSFQPFGLITDIDGTISRIAPSPREAKVSPVCRDHLVSLAERLELVAVISGRPVAEAREMVGVEKVVYGGNHGWEWWEEGEVKLREGAEPYLQRIAAVLQELSSRLPEEELFLENKGVTLAIHYRCATKPEATQKAIQEALADIPAVRGLRIALGRKVVELCPPVEVDKGLALKELVGKYQLAAVVYLGDDLTDVDAFRALHSLCREQPLQGIAIGVVEEETPSEVLAEADFCLRGVTDVERFLGWLVSTARQRGTID
jgi:trehalose 6-phosphate phosphatase